MRKRFIALMALLLLTVPFLSSVQAVPTADLTALARYYPEDAPLFAAIRTDDGYFETLNGLVDQINANLGGGVIPASFTIPTAPELLDQIILNGDGAFLGVTFDWVGETLAFGTTAFTPEPAALLALDVNDRELAETELRGLLVDTSSSDVVEVEGYLLFANEAERTFIALTEDAAIVSDQRAAVVAAAERADATLADSETFNATLSLLPQGDYNIAAYADLAALTELAMMMTMSAPPDGTMELAPMMPGMDETAQSKLAIGATILDGRSLVLDLALRPDNPDVVVNQPGYVEEQPVNLDFAAYLPAYTQLAILDNDAKASFDAGFAALDALGPMLQAQLIPMLQMEMDGMDGMGEGPFGQMGMLDLSTVNFGGALKNFITQIFAGFTGLNLEDDVLAWQTGDYAMTASLLPVASDLVFTLDITSVTAATDPAAAADVVSQLTTAGELYNLGLLTENIAEANALVLPDLIPSLPVDLPPPTVPAEAREIDLIVASDDNVFVVGSRPGATYALTQDGPSLLDNPVYQYASSLFLPESYQVWYASGVDIANAILALAPLADEDTEDLMELRFVIAQVESLTISVSRLGDGVDVARLTLSLPESAPAMPSSAGAPAEPGN
ncbi:MAG: hypothetical protein ACOCXZ_01705 [Chloroflexota bacterium]